MYDIKIKGDECIIPTNQLIELLEYKVESLKKAKEEDSSWNYGIEDLEEQIKELQLSL